MERGTKQTATTTHRDYTQHNSQDSAGWSGPWLNQSKEFEEEEKEMMLLMRG